MKRIAGIPPLCFAVFIALALVFILLPQIDLWMSGLFWDPEHRFFRYHTPAVLLVYHSVEVLSIALVIGLLILIAIIMKKGRAVWGVTRKECFYLLVVLALGPGLVVNVISKNISGRARPNYVEPFGGEQQFTPAFVLSDQCSRNCSFVSGHASIGFYFVALALVLRQHRKKTFVAAIAYGTLVGFGRIAQGGHYLSDVVFAFFFVYFTARATYYIMFERSAERSP
ncbi:phosphatase PAP2 family protein [Desulfatitalea alkaliphila]|uniref:Phosphatase PAP2 family protein n=1 Tax=Desulfatitalea alkaliphila TaxID=2929485 RepID=A0AA41R869_9BACT|nr:phosphatase PAP2 family protein [Desulfatitalea alkaliphila]MCJ8500738.1 phosphatase PAP2 family protein [Desulfatitalea alkaliphila]